MICDRDGTLVKDHGYTHKVADLELLDEVGIIGKLASKLDLPVVIVSNQGGIGLGLFSVTELEEFTFEFFSQSLKRGLKIDAFGYCPHHPNAKDVAFRLNCAYRKPNSESISNFLRLYHADNLKSMFIGNAESDRLAAASVNIPYFDISQVKTSNFVREFTNVVS